MPSECIVPVVEVRNIREHPTADMLSIVEVLGYQIVTSLVEDPKGPIKRFFVAHIRDDRGRRIPANGDYGHLPEEIQQQCDVVESVNYRFRYKEGDRGVYFPADTIIPDEWAEKFDVKRYLRGKEQDRVGRTRLRGEPSFGLLVEVPEGEDWEIGHNARDYFGAKKYEPPARNLPADCAEYDADIDPHFVQYSDIQNGKLLYTHFNEGEEVVATEKIHGANSRIGIANGVFCVGSRTTRKSDPFHEREHDREGLSDEELEARMVDYKDYLFWSPIVDPAVRRLIYNIYNDQESYGNPSTVIVFGEIYGAGVQSLHYGQKKEKGYRAFDVYVDGRYLDYTDFKAQCDLAGVETAPVLYRGPFDLEKIQAVADGNSTLPGAENIREGVVVRPVKERRDPKLGRMILKFIGTEYELSKHKKKDTTDV